MEEISYFDGEPIVKIGEPGDAMYIVSDGVAVVSNHGGAQMVQLRRGDFFGDVALLNDKPRMANVSAASGSHVSAKCLKLRRGDFMKLVVGDLDRGTARIELLLAQVPLMEWLTADRRSALAKAMVTKAFRGGDVIMAQGDDGNSMYIVESGEANVVVEGVGTVAVKSRGDWFGETALLHGVKRTASVISVGNCFCLELDRDAFNEHVLDVMGPLGRIELWLAQVPLLNNLEPGKRLQLAEQMRRRELLDGDEVMHQGDSGDSMFVIEDGVCGIWIENELGLVEVATLSRGQYFGEQALVNNAPRTASVLAKGDGCVVLELTRGRLEESITAHIVGLLTQVPLLASLEPRKRSWLAKGVVLRSFAPGENVIREGDSGESFYIIEQGECVVNVMAVGEVNRLHRGEFFGELALLRDAKRNASIWAGTDVRVLELARPDFDRLIGPLAVQGGLNVRDVLGLGFEELRNAALQFVYLKRWDASKEAFRKCHELKPNDCTVVYNLAAIAATEGEVDATLTWLDKAVDLGLSYDDVRDDIDVMGLFECVKDHRRFLEIWQRLQNPSMTVASRKNLSTPEQRMMIAQDQSDAESQLKWDELMVIARESAGRGSKKGYQEALGHYTELLDMRSENSAVAWGMCSCYSFLREPAAAMEWLQRSIQWGLSEAQAPETPGSDRGSSGSGSSAYSVLTELKTVQVYGALREQPEFIQMRNILRRTCRKQAGKKRGNGRTARHRKKLRRLWVCEIVVDCFDVACEIGEAAVFVRQDIVYGMVLPAAMDSVEERYTLRERQIADRDAEHNAEGLAASSHSGSVIAEGNVLTDEADIEASLLEGGSSLRTIDELMESDWMAGGPSPPPPPSKADGADGSASKATADGDIDMKQQRSGSSISGSDIDASGDLMTIFEIRDELRGRLGLGLSDAHELTVYLSELAGANVVGGGYQSLSVATSDADAFVAAVLANGGGISSKFCRRIFSSLRYTTDQREAKESRRREKEARNAANEYARQRQAAVGPAASLSLPHSQYDNGLPSQSQSLSLSSAGIGGGRWRNVIMNDDLPMNVAAWSIGDVNKWLDELGLGISNQECDYQTRFEKHGLTGERLLVVTHADLMQAGVAVLGHRKLMLKALKALATRRKLSTEPPSGTPDSTPANSRHATPRENFYFADSDMDDDLVATTADELSGRPVTQPDVDTGHTATDTFTTARYYFREEEEAAEEEEDVVEAEATRQVAVANCNINADSLLEISIGQAEMKENFP